MKVFIAISGIVVMIIAVTIFDQTIPIETVPNQDVQAVTLYNAVTSPTPESSPVSMATSAQPKPSAVTESKPVPGQPTHSPTPTPKPSPAISKAASPRSVVGFSCTADTYNCSDFKTRAEAQGVFESCGGTAHDIHRLDRDNDGRVCETL
jgi:hypothetical protein